jgi:hypothetical protein
LEWSGASDAARNARGSAARIMIVAIDLRGFIGISC